MIVRISGEGQYDLPDDKGERLNELDNQVVAAVEAGELSGGETLRARAVVTVDGVEREIVVEGDIALSGEPSGSPK